MQFVLTQLVVTIANVSQIISEIRSQCVHEFKAVAMIHYTVLVVNQSHAHWAIGVMAVDV